jgi:hypothetical protein
MREAAAWNKERHRLLSDMGALTTASSSLRKPRPGLLHALEIGLEARPLTAAPILVGSWSHVLPARVAGGA